MIEKKIEIFTAEWCGSCQNLKKYLYKYSNISYIDIDTPKGHILAKEYNIRSIPFILYNKKEISVTELITLLEGS